MRKLMIASLLTATAVVGSLTGASAATNSNEAWCLMGTDSGVLNCEFKTKAACEFTLELITLPNTKCVRNPNRR
jgi:Protein of unknown function (DUF3551)